MITLGQPIELTLKKGHHVVTLERFEANPLHVMAGLAAPGSFFFKLTVDGQMRMCRQEAAEVQAEFRDVCRSVGIFSGKKFVEVDQ